MACNTVKPPLCEECMFNVCLVLSGTVAALCYRNWDKLWPDGPLGVQCMQNLPFVPVVLNGLVTTIPRLEGE